MLLAVEHELAHHAMRLAERHPLLGKVVGHVRGGRESRARLCEHDVGVHGPGLHHARGDLHAVREGARGVERALLALLEVLVVGERQRLHRGEKRHQVAVDAAGLAARELGEVGVLLLRHDRGSG